MTGKPILCTLMRHACTTRKATCSAFSAAQAYHYERAILRERSPLLPWGNLARIGAAVCSLPVSGVVCCCWSYKSCYRKLSLRSTPQGSALRPALPHSPVGPTPRVPPEATHGVKWGRCPQGARGPKLNILLGERNCSSCAEPMSCGIRDLLALALGLLRLFPFCGECRRQRMALIAACAVGSLYACSRRSKHQEG